MPEFTLGELAVRHGLELRGDPDRRVSRVGTLKSAGPEALSFLANPKYRRQLASTRAGAVVLDPDSAGSCPVPALLSGNPYVSYARIAADLHPEPGFEAGVSPAAWTDPSAILCEGSWIGPGSVVEAGAVVGPGSFVGPGCVVGQGARLGAGCRLVARVTLCRGVVLGDRVIVHPGAVIGADGFGLARGPDGWIKIPQVGTVRIGDDVEIGAATTIDRGAIEDTVIEDGVKLDNQIQVAHNVRIGEHTIIAGCTGISGSTTIGKRCYIGGGAGFVGHLTVADDVVVTGQTMVSHSLREPGVYSSALSADDAQKFRRNAARFRRLDALARRVQALERLAGIRAAGDGGEREGKPPPDGDDE